jgi:hypothetical protein
MGKRSRQRGKVEKLAAPTTDYPGTDGSVLTLRGALSPRTRRQYADTLGGKGGAQTKEDAWQRAIEMLFERLVLRWDAAGVVYEKQSELLARFRVASTDERRWVRDVLREHCAAFFPDVEVV